MVIALWLAWIGSAGAGPMADLAAAAGGEAVVAIRCDRADRVVGPMAAGQGMGFEAFSALSAGDDAVFDLGAPLYLAVTSVEGGSRLAVEAGVTDAERLAERLLDPAFRGRLPEEATLDQRGDRLRFWLPQDGAFAPSGLPLADRVEAAEAPGCTMIVDVQGLLAGGQAPMPLVGQATMLTVQFESPTGAHRVTMDLEAMPPEVAAVLDGQGPRGLSGVTSDVRFPVVLHVHGTLREVLRALSKLTVGAEALMYAGVAEAIPKRLKGEPGLMLALGPPEVGGALVIPMRRPRSAARLVSALERLAGEIGAGVERLPDGTIRVTPRDRPPVIAGARPGLVVVALLPEVVRDVLSGAGQPWLPEPDGLYGVRLRTEPGMLPMLGLLDGAVEAHYTGGALHMMVQPAVRE